MNKHTKDRVACEGCCYREQLEKRLEESGLTGCRLGMEKSKLGGISCQTTIKTAVCHKRRGRSNANKN